MSLKLRFWKRWPPSAPNQGAQWSLSRTQKKRSRTLSRLLHTDTNFQRSPVLCHESHKKTPISMKMMNRNDLKNHNNLKNLEWQFSKSLEFFICILCWNIFFQGEKKFFQNVFDSFLAHVPNLLFHVSCFVWFLDNLMHSRFVIKSCVCCATNFPCLVIFVVLHIFL